MMSKQTGQRANRKMLTVLLLVLLALGFYVVSFFVVTG
jgi:hypothetical protein